MCICINCRYVKKCSIYRLIEQQHNIMPRNRDCEFIPIQAIININILSKNAYRDWDVIECLSFVEEPGIWLNSY
uniref:hypothetical protein n=1 Tax=Chroothece richteriana TaxID=101928 RepID=UPI001FCDEF62|nr:hypothetical protein MW631_pgp192 [Chroothece richteriana]UNJ14116.1 hypothetical protein [Chroothece richteriana]